jgi:hypothetical protein
LHPSNQIDTPPPLEQKPQTDAPATGQTRDRYEHGSPVGEPATVAPITLRGHGQAIRETRPTEATRADCSFGKREAGAVLGEAVSAANVLGKDALPSQRFDAALKHIENEHRAGRIDAGQAQAVSRQLLDRAKGYTSKGAFHVDLKGKSAAERAAHEAWQSRDGYMLDKAMLRNEETKIAERFESSPAAGDYRRRDLDQDGMSDAHEVMAGRHVGVDEEAHAGARQRHAQLLDASLHQSTSGKTSFRTYAGDKGIGLVSKHAPDGYLTVHRDDRSLEIKSVDLGNGVGVDVKQVPENHRLYPAYEMTTKGVSGKEKPQKVYADLGPGHPPRFFLDGKQGQRSVPAVGAEADVKRVFEQAAAADGNWVRDGHAFRKQAGVARLSPKDEGLVGQAVAVHKTSERMVEHTRLGQQFEPRIAAAQAALNAEPPKGLDRAVTLRDRTLRQLKPYMEAGVVTAAVGPDGNVKLAMGDREKWLDADQRAQVDNHRDVHREQFLKDWSSVEATLAAHERNINAPKQTLDAYNHKRETAAGNLAGMLHERGFASYLGGLGPDGQAQKLGQVAGLLRGTEAGRDLASTLRHTAQMRKVGATEAVNVPPVLQRMLLEPDAPQANQNFASMAAGLSGEVGLGDPRRFLKTLGEFSGVEPTGKQLDAFNQALVSSPAELAGALGSLGKDVPWLARAYKMSPSSLSGFAASAKIGLSIYNLASDPSAVSGATAAGEVMGGLSAACEVLQRFPSRFAPATLERLGRLGSVAGHLSNAVSIGTGIAGIATATNDEQRNLAILDTTASGLIATGIPWCVAAGGAAKVILPWVTPSPQERAFYDVFSSNPIGPGYRTAADVAADVLVRPE